MVLPAWRDRITAGTEQSQGIGNYVYACSVSGSTARVTTGHSQTVQRRMFSSILRTGTTYLLRTREMIGNERTGTDIRASEPRRPKSQVNHSESNKSCQRSARSRSPAISCRRDRDRDRDRDRRDVFFFLFLRFAGWICTYKKSFPPSGNRLIHMASSIVDTCPFSPYITLHATPPIYASSLSACPLVSSKRFTSRPAQPCSPPSSRNRIHQPNVDERGHLSPPTTLLDAVRGDADQVRCGAVYTTYPWRLPIHSSGVPCPIWHQGRAGMDRGSGYWDRNGSMDAAFVSRGTYGRLHASRTCWNATPRPLRPLHGEGGRNGGTPRPESERFVSCLPYAHDADTVG